MDFVARFRKAKDEPEFRFYRLYDKVYREDILHHAYALAKAYAGAPGVDGESFADIESAGLEEWLNGLRKDLHDKTYEPQFSSRSSTGTFSHILIRCNICRSTILRDTLHLLDGRNVASWEEVCRQLNRKLQGWRQYFSQGSASRAYRADDEYVYERVRNFLRRRHKVPRKARARSLRNGCMASWGWWCFGSKVHGPRVRESPMKPVGKPDARNGHVRFDARRWEPRRRFDVSTRAHPRLYRRGA